MPRLLLAPSAPSLPTPEPLAKSGLNSTASITASSMTLTHSSRRAASSPLHDNSAQRQQNLHSGHYYGLNPALWITGANDVDMLGVTHQGALLRRALVPRQEKA